MTTSDDQKPRGNVLNLSVLGEDSVPLLIHCSQDAKGFWRIFIVDVVNDVMVPITKGQHKTVEAAKREASIFMGRYRALPPGSPLVGYGPAVPMHSFTVNVGTQKSNQPRAKYADFPMYRPDTSPPPPRETCREHKWHVARDAHGKLYVSKGPLFVMGPKKDVDATDALDTLAIIHADGGLGHPNNRAFLRQIGEDLYTIGEGLQPGLGGIRTLLSVYSVAKEAWSPDALVLESLWEGIVPL
jgi:hypothetical protein